MKKMELKDILLEEAAKKKKEAEVNNNMELQKGTLGTKVEGILGVIKNHKKGTIATSIALAGIITIFATSCSKQHDENKDFEEKPTTTIEEVIETTPEITTTVETTTKATTTTPAETTTEETTTKEAETTTVTVSVTEETAEIIVTPAETKAPVETTTTAQTTTVPVTTTAETQKVVEPAKPIQVEDLNGKVALFKEELKTAGLIANDDMIKNAIRVINSDVIEHDGLNEITAQRYESSLSLLSSYGSANSLTLSSAYLGDLDKVEKGFYIPLEICPKENQKIIDAFTKLAESYRLALNSIGAIGVVELTPEEEGQIGASVLQDLDKLNIADNKEWDKKYTELYTAKWQEKSEVKQNEMATQRNAKVQAEYNEFFDGVIVLVNSKEYENLTPAEKVVIFTNISGALVSGMTEDQKNEYMSFHNGIVLAMDEARAVLVIASRNNTNQKDALNEIITNNQPKIDQERKDLLGIAAKLESMYSSNKEYSR